MIALGLYGFVATLQPDAHFGRILAACDCVFVAGSLAWGMPLDGFRPDRWGVIGALICLAGVGVITYAPRGRLLLRERQWLHDRLHAGKYREHSRRTVYRKAESARLP